MLGVKRSCAFGAASRSERRRLVAVRRLAPRRLGGAARRLARRRHLQLAVRLLVARPRPPPGVGGLGLGRRAPRRGSTRLRAARAGGSARRNQRQRREAAGRMRLEAEQAVRDPAERDRDHALARVGLVLFLLDLVLVGERRVEAETASGRHHDERGDAEQDRDDQARRAGQRRRPRARPAGAAARRRSRRRGRSAAARCAGRVRQAMKPAASGAPASHSGRRSRIRSSGRWVNSRQPQNATGSTIAMAASPNSCISRSAAIAPPVPSRLCTGPPLA